MRYVLLFAAIMALLTTHARARAELPPSIRDEPPSIRERSVKPAPVKPVRLQNASHTCPTCGGYQNVVNQESGGEHSHKCNHAGTVHAKEPPTEWWHADPAPAASFTLPASGCPSGNCASPKTQARWRLFR